LCGEVKHNVHFCQELLDVRQPAGVIVNFRVLASHLLNGQTAFRTRQRDETIQKRIHIGRFRGCTRSGEIRYNGEKRLVVVICIREVGMIVVVGFV